MEPLVPDCWQAGPKPATRPEFAMVTGISTGALTAPFAFLGSDYDDELKEVYTTVSTEDVSRKRNLIAAVFGDSMVDTKPLREMIVSYFNIDIIKAIAREHKKRTTPLHWNRQPGCWQVRYLEHRRHCYQRLSPQSGTDL